MAIDEVKPRDILLVHLGRSGSTVIGSLLDQVSGIRWHGEIWTLAEKNGRQFSSVEDFIELLESHNRPGKYYNGYELKYVNYKKIGSEVPTWRGFLSLVEDRATIGATPVALLRNNVLRRIVSVRHAAQSGVWHLRQNEKSAPVCVKLPTHDLVDWDTGIEGEIESVLEKGVAFNSLLKEMFSVRGWPVVTYETDVAVDPARACNKITRALSYGHALSYSDPSFQKTLSHRPLAQCIDNYKEVEERLVGTSVEWMLEKGRHLSG